MTKSKSIIFPEYWNDSSGIEIKYIKSRDSLYISGYYDHIVGIEGTEIKFKEFCNRLDINLGKKRD